MQRMASKSKTERDCIAKDWLDEEHLMLLECWSRDGYTYQDIANRIGIGYATLREWRVKYPEVEKALKNGREIIDYKVENALLKSALGYKAREVKVTTTMRYGKVVETVKEVTDKEQAPNVSAIQCWLYNRLPKKWKNMNSRANILDDIDEDTSIHVTVTRASKNNNQNNEKDEDQEWEQEMNQSIEIRNKTEQEKKEEEQERKKKKEEEKNSSISNIATKIIDEEDLDYWPDDWEDEDET